MADYYYTIAEENREEVKITKSRFIATAIPVKNKDQAKAELDRIRKEFQKDNPSHNCWAYRLGEKGLEYSYSDDGEPNGTAGKPILFAIKKYDLSDILVVVTRFFGGTKLGKGGLSRAYGDSTEEVLKVTDKLKVDIVITVMVFCNYEEINVIKRLLNEYAITFEENYTDTIEINSKIPISKVDEFCDAITSKTNGNAGYRVIN